MKTGSAKAVRCAIYTRVSTDQKLEQDFNSLDAQYDASQAYIRSQAHAGWTLLRGKYDDGGFSGGDTDRPALQRLLDDVRAGKIDVIVVYKVDRLTRSLSDFAKLVELFDKHNVSFVSVTQQFNTTTSMGRLTLNVLLSFAQFEREVTSERIRDKISASKRKGLWVGGMVPLGYDTKGRKITVNEAEAERVRTIFRSYLKLGSINLLMAELRKRGIARSPRRWRQRRLAHNRQAVELLVIAQLFSSWLLCSGVLVRKECIDQFSRWRAVLSHNRWRGRNCDSVQAASASANRRQWSRYAASCRAISSTTLAHNQDGASSAAL
jgi:DNA invertase Pin-like site-specific DNA recombinase